MANTGLKNKILSISPYLEVVIRMIYWKYNFIFKFFRQIRFPKKQIEKFDFNEILQKLDKMGVKKGSILILHSSFENLQGCNKNPKEVISLLLEFLGNEGTLAMNAGRMFPEENKNAYLKSDYSKTIVTYDLIKSRVWTGVLPHFLLKHPQAEISRFPINSMVAVGKHAKSMMENNLNHNSSSCGITSAWSYCVDNNASIVALGTDLVHSLTIMHVAEERNSEKWYFKNWYRDRIFRIIDKDFDQIVNVKERKPKWGAMHFAERTLCKDLINKGLLKSSIVHGVLVETISAKDLINFLMEKNENGYPYFLINSIK